MTFEPSWTVIIIGLLVSIGLFFALKSFAMPPTFDKNQRERENLKKRRKDNPPGEN